MSILLNNNKRKWELCGACSGREKALLMNKRERLAAPRSIPVFPNDLEAKRKHQEPISHPSPSARNGFSSFASTRIRRGEISSSLASTAWRIPPRRISSTHASPWLFGTISATFKSSARFGTSSLNIGVSGAIYDRDCSVAKYWHLVKRFVWFFCRKASKAATSVKEGVMEPSRSSSPGTLIADAKEEGTPAGTEEGGDMRGRSH